MNVKTIQVLELNPIPITSDWKTYKEILISQFGLESLHGISNSNSKILPVDCNGVISMLYLAFQNHLGIRVTPSMIWLLILQGIGNHINNDPEKWRSRCVSHTGKIELNVVNNNLGRNLDENEWNVVISEFVEKINTFISTPIKDSLQVSFSEGTLDEKIAFNTALMYTMQRYFEFTCTTLCGIPKIEITGSIDDWQNIIDKTEILTNYFEMTQWREKLIPILRNIHASLKPDYKDIGFWKNIYKHDSASGGPYINGWIVYLFPYLKVSDSINDEKTNLISNWFLLDNFKKVSMDNFPSGISSVPVKWKYLFTDLQMIFEAGFMGVKEVDRNTLTPFIGWFMRDEKYTKPKEKSNEIDCDNYKGFFESGNKLEGKNNLPIKHIKLSFLDKIRKFIGFK